jgi:hypothetical protein
VNEAYNSEDCEILAQALEHAWAIFLKASGLNSQNIDTAKAALTYGILEAASTGQRNPHRLAISAVAQVNSFEPHVRRQRSRQWFQGIAATQPAE